MISREDFVRWGAQGGRSRDGAAKRRGGKAYYSKLGKLAAAARRAKREAAAKDK